MKQRVITALIAFVLLGLPAIAQNCPVAGDLKAGVRITYDDDSVIEYIERSPGIIEEIEVGENGEDDYVIVTNRGVLEVEYFSRAKDSDEKLDLMRIEYDLGDKEVFPLTEGKMLGGTETEIEVNGEVVGKHLFSMWVDGPGRIQIGTCEYETIPVSLRSIRDNVPSEISLIYLPELDMGIVTIVDEWGSDPYAFTPETIEVISR